jgi:hypothetical protein
MYLVCKSLFFKTLFICDFSRFDLFFVIVDECDEVSDFNLARHIVGMHKDPNSTSSTTDFSTIRLQRYIRFARTMKPKVSQTTSSFATKFCDSPIKKLGFLVKNFSSTRKLPVFLSIATVNFDKAM